jgi:hypothetical protein
MTRKIERSSPAGSQITRPALVVNPTPTIHVGHESSTGQPTAAAEPRRVQLGTYIPEPLKRELKTYCAAQDIEIRDAVTTAITEWLASQRAGSLNS